jgi:hypothetical protein
VTVFLWVVVGLLYLLLLGVAGVKLLDYSIDYPWERKTLVMLAVVILLIAAPVAAVVSASGMTDPNANRLCVSGHEEWVTRRRPAALVGKVFVPGGTYTRKAWFCDRWE